MKIQLPLPPPDDRSKVFSLEEFPPLEDFEDAVVYPALSIPAQMTASLRKDLKSALLFRPKLKTIHTCPDDPNRRILLLRRIDDNTVDALDDSIFKDAALVTLLADSEKNCQKTSFKVSVKYEDFTTEEILKKLIAVKEVPSAFETVGSLVHVNLRDDVLPFKYWVGKVILDKLQPRIRTVVNKVGTIETEYRTFEMEVIAGDENEGWSVVTVKEEGCSFELDFRQVYWNSRLVGEHRRLVNFIRKEARQSNREKTVVADLMAGVGPFAVPLTSPMSKRKKNETRANIEVLANDLNPSSYKYLCINASSNKCGRALESFNMDGRTFVHHLQKDKMAVVDHVIMNLPASAPEFLDAFRGWSLEKLPQIHVHCFCAKVSESDHEFGEAIERCSNALGCSLNPDDVDIHVVRDISPTKFMLCLSFQLPVGVRKVPRLCLEGSSPRSPEPKRARTE